VRYFTGPNGAMLGFSEPLPPVIAAQVACGELRPAEPPAEPVPAAGPVRESEPSDSDRVPVPAADAPRQAWIDTAVAMGMPEDRAKRLNMAGLRKYVMSRAA
jgi:hypothetical protein